MEQFQRVTVNKEANVYFDGKVTSRTLIFSDGAKKSLGIMLPGEYEFSTTQKEVMEIISGDLSVLLPGKKEWKELQAGHVFTVSAGESFKVKVNEITDYCCSYISDSQME